MHTHSKLDTQWLSSPPIHKLPFPPCFNFRPKRTKNAGVFLFLAMSLLFAQNVVCGVSSKNEIPLYHHHSKQTPFTHYTGSSIAAAAVEVTCGEAATDFTSFLPPMHLLRPCSTYYYYCTVHPLHVTGCRVGRRRRQQQQLFLEPAWAKSRPGW